MSANLVANIVLCIDILAVIALVGTIGVIIYSLGHDDIWSIWR